MLAHHIRAYSLRTSAALVSQSFSNLATTIEDISDYDFLGLEVRVVMGAADSISLQVEESNIEPTSRTDNDWFNRVSEATASGVTTVSEQYYTFTATGQYALAIHPIRTKAVRIKVKCGGDVDGTNLVIKGYVSNAYLG